MSHLSHLGFGGTAYWASSFNDSLFTYLDKKPKGCFYHDDVWLSGYLQEKGVKCYLLYGMENPFHFERHPNLSISSLGNTAIQHQLPCVNSFRAFKPQHWFVILPLHHPPHPFNHRPLTLSGSPRKMV